MFYVSKLLTTIFNFLVNYEEVSRSLKSHMVKYLLLSIGMDTIQIKKIPTIKVLGKTLNKLKNVTK